VTASPHRKLPPDGVILALIESGKTQAEIAKMYGCAQKNVSVHLSKADDCDAAKWVDLDTIGVDECADLLKEWGAS
jgi:predicted transcriptional regulator